MSKYLQKKFALSEQGGKDLLKASISCVFTNLGLMLPMTLLFMLIEQLLYPLIGRPASGLEPPGLMLLSILLLGIIYILQYNQYNTTFFASYKESASMRIRLSEKLRQLPLSFFGKRDLADLTTTIMADCAWMEKAFSHYIPQLIGSVISTVLIGIAMLCLDWRMGIAMLWVAAAAFLLASCGRPIIDRQERRQKGKKLAASDGIQEYLETIQDIKANNQTESYLADLDAKIAAVEQATVRLELMNGILVTSSQMILKAGMATTVLTGAVLMSRGELDIMMFLIFLMAATRIYIPLTSCLESLSAVYSTMLQVERMHTIAEQPIQTGSKSPVYQGYDITFTNVGFAYNDSETVLKDVSFTARQGQVTALVGPSGGGKSTAARLAARFWDVDRGKVTIGGVDVKEVDPEELLKQISIVFQEVVLFNNTVMENIRLGKKDATDEEVILAAKAAQCHTFIGQLPQGYQTRIGENGAALSGGERQRISIARALLKDAPIILLDEATASLDVENESLVQEAISNLIKNKTVLIIAHRMRTVAGADQIIVLKDGYVAEAGKPQELMSKESIYRHMAELQQQSFSWSLQ